MGRLLKLVAGFGLLMFLAGCSSSVTVNEDTADVPEETAISSQDDAEEQRLRQDAEDGDVVAMSSLGLLLEDRGDLVEAEEWYRKAVSEGDVVAMSSLGVLLETQGDLVEAEEWYRKGAAEGDVVAMTNLGGFLQEQGDLVEAEEWLRKADAATKNG